MISKSDPIYETISASNYAKNYIKGFVLSDPIFLADFRYQPVNR